MTDIMRATKWRTNAHMIADVAKLGYIEGDVLDATYGQGGFWKKLGGLTTLTTNDLNSPWAIWHDDFRALHWDDNSFDTVVYDPPYKLNGTPTGDAMDQRFGTGEKMTLTQKIDLILDGAYECRRVANKWLLIKCMDQVVSGRMFWMTKLLWHKLEDGNTTLLHDRFDFLSTPRPQPGDRPQQHARSNYSTLLVFRLYKPTKAASSE